MASPLQALVHGGDGILRRKVFVSEPMKMHCSKEVFSNGIAGG